MLGIIFSLLKQLVFCAVYTKSLYLPGHPFFFFKFYTLTNTFEILILTQHLEGVLFSSMC